jgi:hypothetical protein
VTEEPAAVQAEDKPQTSTQSEPLPTGDATAVTEPKADASADVPAEEPENAITRKFTQEEKDKVNELWVRLLRLTLHFLSLHTHAHRDPRRSCPKS